MRTLMVTTLAFALGVAACNDKSDDQPAPAAQQPAPPKASPPTTTTTPQVAVSTAPPAVKPTAEFKIAAVGNTMTFDITTFTVSPGQPVHVVFHNNSTMKLLPHNWVLLAKPGTEAAVAAAGLKKGEPGGYLDAPSEDILAYTPTAAMGQTVETTFTAPMTPGSYPYICTVPGHYMKMKGTLIVQ